MSKEPHTLRWTWAIRDEEFSQPRVKMVAFVIAAFANERNVSFPTRERIALEVDISIDGVKRSVRELEARGYLETTVTKGRGKSNEYTLTFPKKRLSTSVGEELEASLGQAENGAENGASPLPENGAALHHQERHQERSLPDPNGAGEEILEERHEANGSRPPSESAAHEASPSDDHTERTTPAQSEELVSRLTSELAEFERQLAGLSDDVHPEVKQAIVSGVNRCRNNLAALADSPVA